MAALGKCESLLRFDFESSTQDVEASDRDSSELPDYCKTRIKMLIDEEVLMAVARDSAFRRDFRSVIRAVAERRLAHGVPATWQLVREIREEAIADLSLASRWPAAMIEALALDDTTAIPPLDGNPTANEPDDSSDVVRAVIVVLSERSAGGGFGSGSVRCANSDWIRELGTGLRMHPLEPAQTRAGVLPSPRESHEQYPGRIDSWVL